MWLGGRLGDDGEEREIDGRGWMFVFWKICDDEVSYFVQILHSFSFVNTKGTYHEGEGVPGKCDHSMSSDDP